MKSPLENIRERYSTSPNAEKILNLCLILSLVLGAMVVMIMIFVALYIAMDDTLNIVLGGLGPVGIILLAVIVLILFIISWAVQKVFLNISNNLHALRDLAEVIARNTEETAEEEEKPAKGKVKENETKYQPK